MRPLDWLPVTLALADLLLLRSELPLLVWAGVNAQARTRALVTGPKESLPLFETRMGRVCLCVCSR